MPSYSQEYLTITFFLQQQPIMEDVSILIIVQDSALFLTRFLSSSFSIFHDTTSNVNDGQLLHDKFDFMKFDMVES